MSVGVDLDIDLSDRENPHRDEDVLRALYWGSGLTQKEIAEVLDVSLKTVGKWMRRNGIETRRIHRGPTHFHTDSNGYECWRCRNLGRHSRVQVHRLLMVAEHGWSAVAEADVVHHQNEIPWDNRPENLELMTKDDHVKYHNDIEREDTVWRDEGVLYDEYVEKGKTTYDIADELGVSDETVRRWLHNFDISVRGRWESA